MNEMLTCMYETGPPPHTHTQKNPKQLKKQHQPPPDEIHRGVEIVVNTDITGRASKKLSQAFET